MWALAMHRIHSTLRYMRIMLSTGTNEKPCVAPSPPASSRTAYDRGRSCGVYPRQQSCALVGLSSGPICSHFIAGFASL